MIWGVFDSGVGGLTVVRALREQIDRPSLVYLGDTARVPYGIRSQATVRQYAHEAAEFFAEIGVDGIIVACNTASAVALDQFAGHCPGPVLGVVDPGVRAALDATRGGAIGVIGTAGTVRSDAYGRRIRELAPERTVVSVACPLLVPLAEEGWTDGEVPELVAHRYLAPLMNAEVDTVILGCTHYPLLKPVIGRVLGAGVALVDSADAVAREAAAAQRESSASRGDGAIRFCVTDAGGTFADIARRFLGESPIELETVHLGHH